MWKLPRFDKRKIVCYVVGYQLTWEGSMEVYKIVSGGAEYVFFDLEDARDYADYLLDMQGVIVGIEVG